MWMSVVLWLRFRPSQTVATPWLSSPGIFQFDTSAWPRHAKGDGLIWPQLPQLATPAPLNTEQADSKQAHWHGAAPHAQQGAHAAPSPIDGLAGPKAAHGLPKLCLSTPTGCGSSAT